MKSFIEEFYYGNIEPQGRSRKQSPAVKKEFDLGVGLAMQGKKVLLVDADPQGDLTTCLGWQDTDNLPIALPDKMVEVMQDKCKEPMKGILHHKEGVDLIPSNSDLFDFEISLVTAMNREAILRNYLNEVKHNYDYIIMET